MIKSSLGIAVWKDLYTAYTRKIIRKKLRYFRLTPNLAPRKSIDVTNYVACSTEPPIGSYFHAMQWFLLRLFCFCEEWKFVSTNYDQIQVKQIILKDSGG